MDNRELCLETEIEIGIISHGKLLREIADVGPEKGMEVSITELKELQNEILKNIKKLNKKLLKDRKKEAESYWNK